MADETKPVPVLEVAVVPEDAAPAPTEPAGGDVEALAETVDALNLNPRTITEVCDRIMTEDPKNPGYIESMRRLRKMLSVENTPPIGPVLETGVLPTVVEVAGNEEHAPGLRFEALWVLTNLASGNREHTATVVEAGVITICNQVLAAETAQENAELLEQAVWTIGNIAGDCAAHRDAVLLAGSLPLLLRWINEASRISLLRNTVWAVSNCCRGKPAPALDLVASALPRLAQALYYADNDVQADALWALSYISDGNAENIQRVIEANCTRRVIELMAHGVRTISTPALRIVGNLVTGDDVQTQVVINNGAIPVLAQALQSEHTTTSKEAAWAISNITAGHTTQIQAVVDGGIVPVLLRMLAESEFRVAKEAMWAVSNYCSGGNEMQLRYLFNHPNLLDGVAKILSSTDNRTVMVAVEMFSSAFKVCPDLAPVVEGHTCHDLLSDLRSHRNEDVASKVERIFDEYFECFPVKAAVSAN